MTHDQEEATEVAEEIVGINEGRIERAGSPDQLYDAPGQRPRQGLPRRGDPARQRPPASPRHRDHPGPALAGSIAADPLRVTRVGFEVRLVAGTEDGQEVSIVTTRSHARSLGLEEGQRLWLTPATGATTVPAMASVLAS